MTATNSPQAVNALGGSENRSGMPWNWLAESTRSNWERASYVLMFAILVAARLPRILLEGRFWAEDGRVFFENAWNLPWFKALFMPHAGYLNFTANLAGVLERYLVPLSAAPYVGVGLALLFQCVPAILLVTSRDEWLQRRIVVLAALLIVAIPADSLEVLLNTTNSHFHLGLAVAIILALEPRLGPVGIFQLVVLFVAPLCGPSPWVLVPLFALRAAIDRSKLRTLQTLVLFAGLAVQLGFFFSHDHGRHFHTSLELFGAIILAKQFIAPFFSFPSAFNMIDSFAPSFTNSGGPIWPLMLVMSLSAVALSAAILYPKKSPLWLLCGAAIITLVSYAGAVGDKTALVSVAGGGRYAFIPQILSGLAVLSWSVIHRGYARFLAQGIVVWLLAVGIMDYAPSPEWLQDGPPWRAEVQKWQQDRSYVLKIWPPGWTVTLP
jgi:hypothetical protein